VIPSKPTIKRWGRLAAIFALCAFTSFTANAQLTTADVLGTVTDSTGALVSGASLTLKNLGTGITAQATSNQTGSYLFTLLIPGRYSLSVDAKGFKKMTFTDIALAAGDRMREDVKLETGGVEETVVVTSSAPLFQTDSASLSSVVTEQSVQDLPLNGRNFVNLVQLQPGVNQGSPSAISSGNRPDDRRQSATIVANGQSDLFNNNMIEGMDNNEREQGLIGVRPSIDAIAEVKVDTNAFNAEVGRSAGAVVNIITKSGANDIHGSAYEYFRNDIFDAREFFTRQGVTAKPEYRQNQFGGSVGGPIVRNKTFFFADAEDNRNILGSSSGLLTVPTLYEEENPGDFSDIGGPKVPPAALDPVGLAYFKMYPKPNVSSTATINNFSAVSKRTQYAASLDGRIDHNFKNGDTLFGRYSYNNINTTLPGPFPAVSVNGVTVQPGGSVFSFAGPSITKAHGVQFNYLHLFSPNVALELKTGYTRIDIDTESLNHGKNISSQIGLVNANTPAAPATTGLMPIAALGYSAPGDSPFLPILDRNNTFQYMGAVTYTRGNHNLKIGQQLTRRQLNYFQSGFPLGFVIFAGLTGNSLEDLMVGLPLGYIRINALIEPGLRAWETGTYAQDNWRVNNRLTLNLGVRYEVYTPISEAHNRYANFDYPTLKLIQGSQDKHVGIKTNYANISPRFGFSQSLAAKTLIRGGFGISYYPTAIQGQLSIPNPPYQYSNTCIPCFGKFTWPTLPVPTPSSTTDLSGSLTYMPKNFNTSYVQQFNLMLQQEFGQNVLTIGGVGELARRLLFQPYINIPNPNGPYPDDASNGPSAPPALLTATALPNMGEISANLPKATTNYYGMQLVFARRFTKGLAFNANYTWAHGLSDAVSGSSILSATGLLASNAHYDYGNSAVDIRHRIALNWNYLIPLGKDEHGLAALLKKGWTWNSVIFWQTGQPFTVSDGWTNANGVAQINLPLTTTDRPNVTGKPYRTSNPSINNWLNAEAFTPQPAGTAGNEASGQFFGPHTRRADISLFKNFDLPEKMSLQFRAECYNISNTPNFSIPNAAITAWTAGSGHTATTPISKVGLLPGDTPAPGTTFGTITSTAANLNPRQMQFALKLMF